MDQQKSVPLKLVNVDGGDEAGRQFFKQLGFEITFRQYEMIKKRIDKAHIADTGERLTQKGKIAIIFTLERDRTEYMEYIEYLQHEGWIDGDLEEFLLEDFQGVERLRAIRFAVKEQG